MSLIWIIAILIAAALAILLLYIARRPDWFRVSRDIVIATPPEPIFAILNDLRRGADWSPFERRDPALRRSFTGPAQGPGSALEWDGNKEVGAGRLSLVDTTPPTHLTLALDMYRPVKTSNIVRFTLEPVASGTRLTWTMEGRANFIAKAFGLVCDPDRMCGPAFEAGLADLKNLAEAEAGSGA
ncbi:SRPBCC family protein [Oceanibaculum pacificum]|uniref:Polyketide cyclase n=1 Tax=Oceanibaculum pacificum TaxID=580166 RepID=A0A154WH30_9PROT|nr:SRPBCC family protein [Oceanibaculum pacificum]KZD12796.1 hypothetical protein AUP43_00185 [Oceanibaculum pacificum]